MIGKVLSYGVVGLLLVALLGGVGYILLSPTEAEGRGPDGGQGQDGERGQAWQSDRASADGGVSRRQGQGQAASGRMSVSGSRGSSAGQGRGDAVKTVEWETLTGAVSAVDDGVTILTSEGEVVVGMGQSAYWAGFGLDVGDELTVKGFYEDGEFKAGTVENLTTGETITLRDGSGRPMWAGGGRS